MVETKSTEQRVLLELEYLQECYNAVLLRKVERGRQSIRTRPGYEFLRSKYQPRVRFLHEAGTENTDSGASDGPPGDTDSKKQINKANQETEARELHDDEIQGAPQDVATDGGDSYDDEEEDETDDDERAALEKVVGVYFDPRIKRFITDVCWPLAHFGCQLASPDVAASFRKQIPEWEELEQEKYFSFTFKMLLWLFPGLPGFEAQDQAERDWQKDCEFDAYGSYGLSYEGFAISLIDLATACTSGSVEACLDFLQIMIKRLQNTLPTYSDPTLRNLLAGEDGDEGDPRSGEQLQEEIVWRQIPLERLSPCQLRPKAQYYELKAKVSVHPLVLMVLLGNEKPAELQLSTSAKLLIRERDSRTSIRRKTIALKSHFIELEKQFLWTFRDLGDRPSLLLIPNHCISRRTLSLYACLRLIDRREQELQSRSAASGVDGEDAASSATSPSQSAASVPPPILTLFSNVQEPFPLVYGAEKSLCGRIDRQSTRLFVIDHREHSNAFAITLKTSLIQNTASAGGAGAASVVAALTPPSSSASTSSGTNNNPDSLAAHSFIFVVKSQDELISKPNVRVQKMHATLPQQWYTTLSGPNESKSIFIDAPERLSSEDSSTIPESDTDDQEPSTPTPSAAGLYYLYIFSLHGFYFEALYTDRDQLSAHGTSNGQDVSSGDAPNEAGTSVEDDAMNGALGSGEANKAYDLTHAADVLGAARVLNSASLLKRLLLLRKKRQQAIAAEPPPDLLEGARVTCTKSLSVAETLKSKFLRARAIERQVRLLKKEELVQTKVLAKLLRAKNKRGLLTGAAQIEEAISSSDHTATDDGGSRPEHPQSDEDKVKSDAKVALLSDFFKDMAVYQPSQQELQDTHLQQAVDDKKEDALLDHFADCFEDDTALQNLLDEEKWLTSDERALKRKALMQERTSRGKVKAGSLRSIRATAAASSLGEDTTPLTSEDYVSTAKYIEELMQEVAREETESASADNSSRGLTPDDRNAAQLTISWTYAQHRAQTPTNCKNEKHSIHVFVDEHRRPEWMQSQYVQNLAASEHSTRHQENSLRSPFIPSMQSFQDQEQSLPWQAVWEAPIAKSLVRDPCELTVGGDITEQSPRRQTPRSPRRPPQRPKTAASASSFSGSASPRCEISTASQSAAFAYHNTKRIRSAYVRAMKAPPTASDSIAEGANTPIDDIITASNVGKKRSPVSQVRDPDQRGCDSSCKSTHALGENHARLDFAEIGPAADRSPTGKVDGRQKPHVPTSFSPNEKPNVEVQQASPVQVVKPKTTKKRLGKRQSDAEKRFSRQVNELLAISDELKRNAESERLRLTEITGRYHHKAATQNP